MKRFLKAVAVSALTATVSSGCNAPRKVEQHLSQDTETVRDARGLGSKIFHLITSEIVIVSSKPETGTNYLDILVSADRQPDTCAVIVGIGADEPIPSTTSPLKLVPGLLGKFGLLSHLRELPPIEVMTGLAHLDNYGIEPEQLLVADSEKNLESAAAYIKYIYDHVCEGRAELSQLQTNVQP